MRPHYTSKGRYADMRNPSIKSILRLTLPFCLCMLCLFAASGCAGSDGKTTSSSSASTENSFITCFGTVQSRESRVICFPFGVEVQEIPVRIGQIVSPQDTLIRLDYSAILDRRTYLNNTLESLLDQKSGYENELSALGDELKAASDPASGIRRNVSLIRAEADAKSASLKLLENDILGTRKEIETMDQFITGKDAGGVRLLEDGSVTIAQEGYLVDNIIIEPYGTVPSGQPILQLIRMDSLEVVCYVEEQLIQKIHTGSMVRLALYSDNTVIEIGTVGYISQKAVVLNGETVIEVIVDYDGDSFLPGYNIVAKITPQ